MSKTSIEWTEETWNPVTGCDKISPGCKHCYAERQAERLQRMGQKNYRNGFEVTLQPHMLPIPLRRRKPTTYFVNSMSDLFHEQVPQEYVAAVFGVMGTCQHHTFQVLTKRPQRMRQVFDAWSAWNGPENASQACWGEAATVYDRATRDAVDAQWSLATAWPLPNVWLGVSVEDRKYGLSRIDDLRATPAAVRFLSIEPLLEDLGTLDMTGIDWVIVGGESGHGARPMHPDWARSIRDQCVAAGVPFLFKQWGAWVPCDRGNGSHFVHRHGHMATYSAVVPSVAKPQADGWCEVRRMSKDKAGRVLDGRTWDEMPRRHA